ncbi:hypothetical protein [Streptomyces sp. NPDC093109]|uniref:hypothetical protein n=1 Tax=Streptomyces sp. NPDC093109 TaxID=3154977 RepID=UPI00344D1515
MNHRTHPAVDGHADAILGTVFDHFTRRITDVTTRLAAHGIPLTTTTDVPPADPTGPWTSTFPITVDRSTLAWCTAAQMLADHHRTGIDRQVLATDALLRELGVCGLADLHSDLHHGAPVDYRFTRCPYCSGIGKDPTQPTCGEVGCAPWLEFAGHDHICPVCRGDDYQPQWVAEEQMTELEELLADAIKERVSLRSRLVTWLRRPELHL